jgi:hypothetical protein
MQLEAQAKRIENEVGGIDMMNSITSSSRSYLVCVYVDDLDAERRRPEIKDVAAITTRQKGHAQFVMLVTIVWWLCTESKFFEPIRQIDKSVKNLSGQSRTD